MSFKKTKVVMLPTNEKAPLILGTSKNGKLVQSNSSICNGTYVQNQHLYFISDEEIKEGDWFYLDDANIIAQYTTVKPVDDPKKIIATTDSSLEIVSRGINPVYEKLPQPSNSFIQKYVEAYNSDKPITEVNVEHRHLGGTGSGYVPKVNSKDNTITIKKVKDSWSREEVEQLIYSFNEAKEGRFNCTKWIEENL